MTRDGKRGADMKKLRKRFILFAGEWYHPSGGVYDVVDIYETEVEALQAHVRACRRDRGWLADWAHILNIETFMMRAWSAGDERWSDWKIWDRLDTVNSDPRTAPPIGGGDDEKIRA